MLRIRPDGSAHAIPNYLYHPNGYVPHPLQLGGAVPHPPHFGQSPVAASRYGFTPAYVGNYGGPPTGYGATVIRGYRGY